MTRAPLPLAARARHYAALLLIWAVVSAFGCSLVGCSWFKPAAGSDRPAPAQAVVLYVAKAVEVANTACSQAADAMVTRATFETAHLVAIETAHKGENLAKECLQATVTARRALESVEKLIETGVLVSEAKVGCAVKRGLDAAQDICAFMKSAKVGKCPAIVDSAITFGSPLLAVAGACPLKEGK